MPTASMLTLLVLVALVVSSPGEDVSAATVCDLVVSCDEDDDERFRVLYRVFRTWINLRRASSESISSREVNVIEVC